ncbi:hypothetical protein BKA66DRAFT_443152 [Pyrenochaeta sp. MPI-SDFR-AT-0127]|nr:hypothetical protein BKA66DRAFT_443152 [Pyrenochaeta sp. MPI-SDFR-AT-0127]
MAQEFLQNKNEAFSVVNICTCSVLHPKAPAKAHRFVQNDDPTAVRKLINTEAILTPIQGSGGERDRTGTQDVDNSDSEGLDRQTEDLSQSVSGDNVAPKEIVQEEELSEKDTYQSLHSNARLRKRQRLTPSSASSSPEHARDSKPLALIIQVTLF